MEKPTLPKGTRDFGPSVMVRRQYILDRIRHVFHLFGFQPLETPAMENLSVLTGKYGDEGDQLLFRVLNSGDFLKSLTPRQLEEKDSRKVGQEISEKGLRYDLTVPFARFVVTHRHELAMPFKRYQIQPVWRADRPQKGRYREFFQCDADVVGTDSLFCEAEVVLMIREVFAALGIHDYTIKINHREVLAGISRLIDAGGKETGLYTAIDKLDKIGEKGVREELGAKGFPPDAIDRLFEILNTAGTNEEKWTLLEGVFKSDESAFKAIASLREVMAWLQGYGANSDHVDFDISLARGLSYYTGVIFEVKIAGVAVGSVSGGGRYDNLTQAFGSKEVLPGIGISFGVDRIYDAMEELNCFPDDAGIASEVIICHLDRESMNYGLRVLSALRQSGISSELFPETAKLKKQLDYANRKGVPFAVVIGSEEMHSGILVIKDMRAGTQENLTIDDFIAGHRKSGHSTHYPDDHRR